MTDIFQEVDEDVRTERFKKLWQRYGWVVMALAVLIVAAVGGWTFWLERREAQRAVQGERYLEAMRLAERGDAAEATKALDALVREGADGYRVLARLYEAGLLAERGEVDAALQHYDGVAADGGADQLYRDLAVLLGAMLRVDREDRAALERRLQPLTREGNPWRYSARELLGVAALKAGARADAKTIFTALADDAAAPAGIRARAAELLATLEG